MKTHVTVAAVLLGVLLPVSGMGFETTLCNGVVQKWAVPLVGLRASSASFAPGPWRDALTESVAAWNKNPSKYKFILTYDDSSVALGNFENETWFSDDPDDYPAVAYSWYTCAGGLMIETDVVFSVDETYTYLRTKKDLWPYGGWGRPFQTTSIHELGHALGLAHENDEYNSMGEDFTHLHTNGAYAYGYVGESSANGAIFLYGNNFATKDLGVVHWRYTGANGEYSTHARTRILNAAGSAVLSSYNDAGEPRYNVTPGQLIQLELTYENNGSSPLTTKANYYISTNDTISTTDQLIGSMNINNMGPNSVWTTNTLLTIPNNLTKNKKYWIGAIIDPANAIVEVNETNNATYVGIHVK